MKRKIIIIVIILGFLAGSWFLLQRYRQIKASNSSAFETVSVERGALTATIGGTGTVRANQTAILTWQTSGIVKQVNAKVGDQVSVDQVLATLETTSLPQNVILAQAELTDAQMSLEDLYTNADITKAKALQSISTYAQQVRDAQYQFDNFTVPTSQANLETMEALDMMKEKLDQAREAFDPYKFYSVENSRRKELKEKLDEAQSDYDAAVRRVEYEYALDVASANLKKARQDYEKWKDGPDSNDIAAAEARIAAAQATLNLARLAASFAGTITTAEIKPGDQVAPGKVAFRLDDLSHLLVDAQISEVDINRVQIGQEVKLTFDAILNQEYHGIVSEVAQAGTSTQGVVDFMITVELADADQEVKPGMTAAVNIVVNQLTDVLLVPNRAVRLLEGKRVVYILQDGKPSAIEITLGASSDTMSEVLGADLKVGDPVVLNPPAVFEQNQHPPFMQR